MKQRERRDEAVGGSKLQAMLQTIPSADGPESGEFDREFRRALFHQAADRVRASVRPATWQAFWETGVLGTSPADAAERLGMTVGAIRVARCRVLARLRAHVSELEKET